MNYFDGYCVNEIIIIDLPLVRLLEPVTLNTVIGLNLGVTERVYNVITFDIDDDGLIEIILVLEESEDIRIIEYNGTNIKNDSSISLQNLSGTVDSEFMIKCGRKDNCLLVWNEDINGDSGARLVMTAFNSQNLSSQEFIIEDDLATNHVYCFPKIRSIAYEDYDVDGTDEYIFSAMKFSVNALERLRIQYVDVSDNLTITREFDQDRTASGGDNLDPFTAGDDNCETGEFENFYTSPLVFDIEDESDGLETVVGVAPNSLEFKMTSYFNPQANTGEMDDYPELAEADGNLLSNPFRANAIEDSGNNDFCVLGFLASSQELDLLCANERGVQFPEDTEYKFSTDGKVNLSTTYRQQSILAHSAQHSTALTGTDNLNELISSYGIFS